MTQPNFSNNNNPYGPPMNSMPGMPGMTGMPPGMTGMNQYGQGTGGAGNYMGNSYQGNPYNNTGQMQNYGYSQSINQNQLPNVNFSVPHIQNPSNNYSMNMGMGGMGNMGGMYMPGMGGGFNMMNHSMSDFNPNEPNVNYMTPRNQSMMNIAGGAMFNMANHMTNYNDMQMEKVMFLLNRTKEIEQTDHQTELIKRNLHDGQTAETREDRQKKRMQRFRGGNINAPPIDVYIPKSEYFNDRDRFFMEQLLMQPLKTNGIFGTRLVTDFDKTVLFDDKSELRVDMRRDNEDEYFEKSLKDGIYLDYIKQIIYSYNIQKIEQRAAREGKKDWFRPNGDLRMDHDIFSDVITKPIDISLSQNEAFATFYSNNSLIGRESNQQLRVFRLRLLISKIILKHHPMFSKEDELATELKELHKEYYAHMNQLNIPYLKQKIITICHKMDEYSKMKDQSPTIQIEMKNMSIFLRETQEFLEEEKKVLNIKANQLYAKWQDLKRLRETQRYQSTRIKLNIIRFRCNQDNPNMYDYAFVLSNTDLTNDPTLLNKPEMQRRALAKNLKCMLKIYINGILVCTTKPSMISWPTFEADFNCQYLLKLFTRPTKLEFELFINDKSVKRFEAEPPGIFAKTVTSSAALFEEVQFGKETDKEKTKDLNQFKKDNTINDLKEKGDENENLLGKDNSAINEQKQQGEAGQVKQVEGVILLKTEWEGRAPDLPPTKIEDKLELVNRQHDFQEEIKRYNAFDYPFDVNDPRNVACVEEMKKGRLEMMLKFIYKEYLLSYFDTESRRHYLIKKRLEKASLADYTFPILESEIIKNPTIQEKLRELKREDQEIITIKEETKIREGIDKINKNYEGKILTQAEYQEMIKAKIGIMKKDIIHTESASYLQVVSEAELYTNPVFLCKEFCTRVFTRARKLAPIRQKPPPVKVEKTESMKINIHVIKAYNVPVRSKAIPSDILDYRKLESVSLKAARNVLIRNQGMFPQMQPGFEGNNPMNNYGSMNNSGVFNPAGTNHNSFNVGQMNNNPMGGGLNMSGMGNMGGMPNYPMGTMGNNPNNQNIMFNPKNPGMMPMYAQPSFNSNAVDSLSKIQFLAEMEKKVNTFVQVKIIYYDQEGIFRTDSVDSIHPDFNQQFEFTIRPKEYNEKEKDRKVYFTREELSKCPGVFYFTLYDEIRIEKIEKAKDANTYIQRFEKKYIGSFSIPFSTLFQNASVLDTLCKVNIPKTVFGYYSDTSSIFDVSKTETFQAQTQQNPLEVSRTAEDNLYRANMQVDAAPVDNIPRIVNPFVDTYVSLYLTVDPIPNFTKNDDIDYSPGVEDSIFLINATKWLKKTKEKGELKTRSIKIFAENFDGASTFIPRFIKPGGQMPPRLIFNENDPNSIEKASRYVALIPFIDDNQTWDVDKEMPDCWCTDEQFLNLGFGDYEEHALLLLNYFNYIDTVQQTGCKSYLVLGDAHPEGTTTYVMRLQAEKKEVEFWNAKTGDCFYFDKSIEENKCLCLTVNKGFKFTKSQTETICQLKSVGAIVSSDNIYVNMQKESDPGLIAFDLDNKSNWLPFLTPESSKKYFPNGITTVQNDLVYTEAASIARAEELKEQIKEYIKSQVEKERAQTILNTQGMQTRWNYTAHANIEAILKDYDFFCLNTVKSGIFYTRNGQKISVQRDLDHQAKLNDLLQFENRIMDQFVTGSYQRDRSDIYGFPINLSFTTKEELWEQVKLTDVHLAASPECELSLSVSVTSFPSEIFSVWIFLAIITNSR